MAVLFAMDRGNDFSAAAIVSKFAEIDALPGAQVQSPVSDGEGNFCSYDGTFSMGRHIVLTFHRVQIIGRIFFYDMIENLFHIFSDIGVGIFIDGQCCRGVLDKEMEETYLREVTQLLSNFIRDEMEATAPGFEFDFYLFPHKVFKCYSY